MPRFTQEDRLIAAISRRSGSSEKLSKLQKIWNDNALESARALVSEGIYTPDELAKDEKWVAAEQLRRDQGNNPEEKEYPEKVDATLAIMKLFDMDQTEQELMVTPIHDRDKLKAGIRFLLTENGRTIGINIDTVLDERGEKAVANSIAKAIHEGEIEKLSTSNLKYIEDEDIRGQLVPKMNFILRRDRASKLADLVAEGDPNGLNNEEKAAKDEIKLEMQIQIKRYIKGFDDLIELSKLGKGLDQAKLAKIKEIKAKLEAFKELF